MPHSHSPDPTAPGFRASYTPDVALEESPLPIAGVSRAVRNAARIATSLLALCGAAAVMLAPFRIRVVGPAYDVTELQLRMHSGDSVLALGEAHDSSRIALLEARVGALESKAELTAYILCMQTRRSDPTTVPPGCAPIVARGGQ